MGGRCNRNFRAYWKISRFFNNQSLNVRRQGYVLKLRQESSLLMMLKLQEINILIGNHSLAYIYALYEFLIVAFTLKFYFTKSIVTKNCSSIIYPNLKSSKYDEFCLSKYFLNMK